MWTHKARDVKMLQQIPPAPPPIPDKASVPENLDTYIHPVLCSHGLGLRAVLSGEKFKGFHDQFHGRRDRFAERAPEIPTPWLNAQDHAAAGVHCP